LGPQQSVAVHMTKAIRPRPDRRTGGALGSAGAAFRSAKSTEPNMAKLTDSQLVILSAASQRPDSSLLPLPKSLKLNKAAAGMVLQSLLKAKLAAEQPAEPSEPVWREDGETKFTIKITESALTQQFNTTTSMGRLMLNVLLSFAQFEREIAGERIRDKIAASKK